MRERKKKYAIHLVYGDVIMEVTSQQTNWVVKNEYVNTNYRHKNFELDLP